MANREIKFKYILQHSVTKLVIAVEVDFVELFSGNWKRLLCYGIYREYIVLAKCEYTGLKDKNGKDMYTKDIFDIGQTVNGQSKFILMECVGGFDVRYAHDVNRKYEYDVNDLFKPSKYDGVVEFEIIGNITQTPELLTNGK